MRTVSLFFFLVVFSVTAQIPVPELKELSLKQKIGQLFVVPAVSIAQDEQFLQKTPYKFMDKEDVLDLIAKHHVGGVIFLGKGKKKEQKAVTQQFQKNSEIPLLICLDAEWGAGMRLLNGLKYKRAGDLQDKDETYVYSMAKEIGNEMKEIGVHINFAPVVDINNNPDNPIIGTRAFSADKKVVAKKAKAYMSGLHAAGIISCAKHFPGHGDTTVDSHKDLPVIEHSMQRLQSIELYPFKEIIKAGVPMVMIAHLSVPALDTDMPTSLSEKTITFLQKKLQFDGLVVTDGLGMDAITKKYGPGEAVLHALLAGNDLLICPVDVPKAVAAIERAVQDGRLSEAALDKHVEKILHMKRKLFA